MTGKIFRELEPGHSADDLRDGLEFSAEIVNFFWSFSTCLLSATKKKNTVWNLSWDMTDNTDSIQNEPVQEIHLSIAGFSFHNKQFFPLIPSGLCQFRKKKKILHSQPSPLSVNHLYVLLLESACSSSSSSASISRNFLECDYICFRLIFHHLCVRLMLSSRKNKTRSNRNNDRKYTHPCKL